MSSEPGPSQAGKGHRNSGAGRNKPRPSLGPDTKAVKAEFGETYDPAKSFNLVVCGATNPTRDGFIFGDFFGLCMAFKQKNVAGEFWSCFPLEEHFEELGKRDPPITDLKYGKFGPARDQALWTYTKFDFEHRERWWTQIGPKSLKDDLLRWIMEKAYQARSGDVVNIVLECHGAMGGAIRLGDHRLWPVDFIVALRAFRDEVHVNIITGACYGGMFVNAMRAEGQFYRYVQAAESTDSLAYGQSRSVSRRTRNSRFSQAFCMSLAKMDFPGLSSSTSVGTNYRVLDHENFVKEQIIRNITPNYTATLPLSYFGDPANLQNIMRTMFFRDSVDILYNPAATHRRRRIEWPDMNLNFRQLIQAHKPPTRPAGDTMGKVKGMLDDEFSKCDNEQGFPDDIGATDYYFHTKHNDDFTPVLKLMYWRGRIQSTIFDVFVQLCMRGFIKYQNVRYPMAIDRASQAVQSLTWLLSCFEGPSKASATDEKLFDTQDEEFTLPLQWLATMIVRSSADITDLLRTIHATKYLGGLDEAKYEEYQRHCQFKQFICNPQEGRCAANLPQQLGFWLPHGIDTSSEESLGDGLAECLDRFNRIEECFQAWFGFMPEQLYTEAQQTAYYDAYPDKLPC